MEVLHHHFEWILYETFLFNLLVILYFYSPILFYYYIIKILVNWYLFNKKIEYDFGNYMIKKLNLIKVQW